MDTSKEYIKMCEKAVEVQELWTNNDGDFCHIPKDYPEDSVHKDYYSGIYILFDNLVCTTGYHNYQEWDFPKTCIWLPRQDQLQGMVEGKEICWRDSLIYSFNEWLEQEDSNVEEMTSMEQLWLAFVMKEKFNKTWNGEDWINA